MESALAPQVFELLARGGWVMGVLLLLSLAAVSIILVKLYQFTRLRIWSRDWLENVLSSARSGDTARALSVSSQRPGPIAHVLTIALTERQRDDLSAEALREEVQRAGDAEIGALESNLRGLEVIGSLAPLLGLLGTVLGMIRAFMRLEEAGARVDPSLLSGGIWEALLTTAVGIAVAVPAMAALAWFESQVDGVRRTMSDAVTRVLNSPASERAPDEEVEQARLRPAGTPRAL
ncbi:MAG: MotA/TolQ/ExbB proton channel family protein [Myxococcota bacterium]|nr:MotA/TolQ/ExbB proton channel family protein [Myxococcota bacterium]